MGSDPSVIEIPRGMSPLGGTEDGRHGPQTSARRDVGVPTDWGCAANGGPGGDRGCDSSYHGIVSGSGAEAGNVLIQAVVGETCPGYTGDKGGARVSGGRVRGGREKRRWRERDKESTVGADDDEVMI